MQHTLSLSRLHAGLRRLAPAFVAGAALTAFAGAAVAASAPEEKELLEQLIDLDADEIADMRAEIADARAEIQDAIAEIEEAREEAASEPGGRAIVDAALKAAGATVAETTKMALHEARAEIDEAERQLVEAKDRLSAEEVAETQGAIDALREELEGLEEALGELATAMKG